MKDFLIYRLLLVVTVLCCSVSGRAQFFEFSFPFGDSFGQRQQQQVETVTKPSYKGGNEALNKYIRKKFKNPQPIESAVEGTITVACIISEKGKVVETGVVKGLSKAYNEEALRVAKKLKFKPAKRGKTKVKSRFDVSFPIRRGRLSFSKLQTVEA